MLVDTGPYVKDDAVFLTLVNSDNFVSIISLNTDSKVKFCDNYWA